MSLREQRRLYLSEKYKAMALTDINFQEGDGQDFILEIPTAVYVGTIDDILVESRDAQRPVVEVPLVTGGGGNIFIMSE